MREPFCLAVDLGGTAIKYGLVTQKGKLSAFQSVPTEAEKGPGHIFSVLARILRTSLAGFSKETIRDHFKGIGIGMPGVVGLDSQTLSHATNLTGWEAVNVSEALSTELKGAIQPENILVENDANLAALGEARYGAGKERDEFIMVTLGTGVGCGIILGNKIYKGRTGAAGELGHISIEAENPTRDAGIQGSLEGFMGQRKIAPLAMAALKNHPDSVLHDMLETEGSALQPKHLTLAAQKGDQLALEVWQKVGHYLGVGLATAVSILDIRKIILGGGVAGAGEFLFQPTLHTISHYTLPPFHQELELLPAKLCNDAGRMGAAARVFDKF
jgi:glucokinase